MRQKPQNKKGSHIDFDAAELSCSNDRIVKQHVFKLVKPLFVPLLQVHAPSNAYHEQTDQNNEQEDAERHIKCRSKALEQIRRAEPHIPNPLFRTITFVRLLEAKKVNYAFFNAQIVEKLSERDPFQLFKEKA